jgi:hypothetical protein
MWVFLAILSHSGYVGYRRLSAHCNHLVLTKNRR